jgi:hypothetical protein
MALALNMSYVVSIKRSESRKIQEAEVRELVSTDSSLRDSCENDGQRDGAPWAFAWAPEANSEPVMFVYYAGEVSATTPSHAALRKMQELASLLDARVVGEGGEDLTEVPVPEWEFTSKTVLSGCAIVVALVIGGLLWLFSR